MKTQILKATLLLYHFLFEVLYCDIDQGIRSMFDKVLITSLCYNKHQVA